MPGIRDQLLDARRRTAEVFPEVEPQDWRRVADAAVDGVLLFYHTQPVTTGRRKIDWSGGHLTHQEWRAQLNRFGQLDALRWAFRHGREERYAEAARDYVEDWLDRHAPYPPGEADPAPGESSLNAAIRLGGLQQAGWLGVLADLMASGVFDEPFAARIVDSIQWQLTWLAANLAMGGNWRIAGLDCLFSQALRLPDRLGEFLPPAAEQLNVEFATQVLDDGVHEERSAGYHDWMCNVFRKLWRLSRRRDDLGLSLDGGRVARMHAYTLHHTKPNGFACGFNDASSRFRTDQATARLPQTLQEQRSLLTQAGLTEEVPTTGMFTSAGHVFYRTGWTDDDLWWAFDAGAWGGGHTHLSRLSIELHNGRRTTLPDPAIFDYEMSNPFAPAGKSTPMHATMNLNLGNQADVDARLHRAVDLPGAVVVQGRYEGGYWPGTYCWHFDEGRGQGWFGTHDRTVIWLKDRAMIVLDCMLHEADVPAYLHWVSDDVPVEFDPERLRLTTGDEEGNVRIQVCPISKSRVTAGIHRGERDPYLGWVAERPRDGVRPAPLLQCRFDTPPARTPTAVTECATVIVPFLGREAPDVRIGTGAPGPLIREVRIDWPDGRTDRVIHTSRLAGPLRRLGGLCTGAALLLGCRPPGAEAETFTAVGG